MTIRRQRAGFTGLLLFGFVSGCQQGRAVSFGAAPTAGAVITPIASLPRSARTAVTIQGTMIEKCPTAGCWFRVRDGSGVVRVDLKSAGFVVSSVPLNSMVTVTGNLSRDEDFEISASGMRSE